VNFVYQVFLLYCRDLSQAAESYDMDRRLYSLPKEVKLRFLIALKNASSSPGFERANLGSNGRYDRHWITDDDWPFA
jgi:hypothetical protein